MVSSRKKKQKQISTGVISPILFTFWEWIKYGETKFYSKYYIFIRSRSLKILILKLIFAVTFDVLWELCFFPAVFYFPVPFVYH